MTGRGASWSSIAAPHSTGCGSASNSFPGEAFTPLRGCYLPIHRLRVLQEELKIGEGTIILLYFIAFYVNSAPRRSHTAGTWRERSGGSGARAPPGGRAGTAELREPHAWLRRFPVGSRGKGLGGRREREDPAGLGEGPNAKLASLIRA